MTLFGSSRLGSYGYHLPVRLARDGDGAIVIAGTAGSSGDAGWSTIELGSRLALEHLAREYPQARMPAWTRLGL
jgi:hypothetical protein